MISRIADVHSHLISDFTLSETRRLACGVLYFGDWIAALVYKVKDFLLFVLYGGKKIKKCEIWHAMSVFHWNLKDVHSCLYNKVLLKHEQSGGKFISKFLTLLNHNSFRKIMLNWFHWFHSENMLIIINYKQEPSPAARIHFSNLYLSKERLTESFISHSHRVHTHTHTRKPPSKNTLFNSICAFRRFYVRDGDSKHGGGCRSSLAASHI